MTSKKIMLIAIMVLAMLVGAIALTGCSENVAFKNIVGFKKELVSKVEIVSDKGAGKDMTHNIDEIFKVLDTTNFVKTDEVKVASDMNIAVSFKIIFHLTGYNGTYTLVFNNGFIASDDFNYKKAKTGFFVASNSEKIIAAINTMFYA